MSHVAFLHGEWRAVFDAARRAEHVAHADPRTACFHARRALKLAVGWVYKHDPALRLPYDDRVSAAHPTLRGSITCRVARVAARTAFTGIVRSNVASAPPCACANPSRYTSVS